MPQVVTHILLPLIILSLFKDWYDSKHKKKFSLRYVLIAGIAGVLPDLDIFAFWILNFFSYTIEEVHRTIAHSLIIPTAFFILFLVTSPKIQTKVRKLKWKTTFLMISIGTFLHIFLDSILNGKVLPLFPFSNLEVGLNLFGYLPQQLLGIAAPSLDGGLMILWLIYLEWKHKISDFF
jgi:membrane-bound metal-dependent hydrolase YbcI (DUF457 family)